jgi:hypothetical protein
VHGHFERRAYALRCRRLELLRRGAKGFVIAIAFLVTMSALARLVANTFGTQGWASVLREGLVIIGWVAMWMPVETFLYGWWPILGEERLSRRLQHADVQVVTSATT